MLRVLRAANTRMQGCKLWVLGRVEAYRFHRRANEAADALRRHSNRELKDIGIVGGRADIQRMAHHKCPWCDRTI